MAPIICMYTKIKLGLLLVLGVVAVNAQTTMPPKPLGPCQYDDYDHILDCSGMNITYDDLANSRVPSGKNVSIKRVLLFKNKLTDLPENFLAEVGTKMFKLDLDNNALTFIPASVLNLAQLLMLTVNDNAIKLKRSLYFQKMIALTRLELNGNDIDELRPSAFDGLESLKALSLRYNRISSVHADAFKGLRDLMTLNLRGNKLTSIQADQFKDLRSLRELDLSENRISRIEPRVFTQMDFISTIELESNELTVLETDLFKDLAYLTEVNLNNNKLTELNDAAFNGCFGDIVRLNNNSITTLPKLYHLWLLSLLQLEDNNISAIEPETFAEVAEMGLLHELLLNGNPLTKFPGLPANLNYLRSLGIARTQIDHIYPCDLAVLPAIDSIAWHQTPIACDCDSKWMKEVWDNIMDASWKEEVTNMNELWTCGSPAHLAGKTIQELRPEDFVCENRQIGLACHPHKLALVDMAIGITASTADSVTLNYTFNGTSYEEDIVQQTASWNTSRAGDYMYNGSSIIHQLINPYTVTNLQPDTEYLICIHLLNRDFLLIVQRCVTTMTAAGTPHSGANNLQKILQHHRAPIAGLLLMLLVIGSFVGVGIYLYKRPPVWLLRKINRAPTGGVINSVYDASGDGKVDIIHTSANAQPQENNSTTI